jgi:Tol biopolymer transport system component
VSCASDDGRFITFQSDATNLVFGDTNAVGDVFVHDRQNGATARVSVAPAGVEANGRSFDAAISPDGRRIAFSSQATNFVSGDTNGVTDIFVRDMQSGVVARVNVASDGTQANAAADGAMFTPDGQAIAFNSAAGNLVEEDTNGVTDVFVRTLSPASTSASTLGPAASRPSAVPPMYADSAVTAGTWCSPRALPTSCPATPTCRATPSCATCARCRSGA